MRKSSINRAFRANLLLIFVGNKSTENMEKLTFASGFTKLNFSFRLSELDSLFPFETTYIIVDSNLFQLYQAELKPWKTIQIPAGESSKSLATIDEIVRQLLAFEAGRDALIIGFGGGVVTDIVGFVAGIYKRGVRFGFLPSSVLAMTDAAIGGKNGVDFLSYKNILGLVRQPEFLLYDFEILKTLPHSEWVNGFAEIIKHACIADPPLFGYLEKHCLQDFQDNQELMAPLVRKNVFLKANVVQKDENENGLRKILNFGHTFGHAIENEYHLGHGQAIAIGMCVAARLSESIFGFKDSRRIRNLLEKYELPTSINYNRQRVLNQMLQDKKRNVGGMDYILLRSLGNAVVHRLSINELNTLI